MNNPFLITMKEINRYGVIKQLIDKQITGEEVCKMLGLKSLRQVYRIKRKVIENGESGVAHKARGRPSNRRFSNDFTQNILNIYKKNYYDFKPTFASEKLFENHNIKISSESLRTLLIKASLWSVKSRRKSKNRHVWRERRANFGEMQQFDGSYHKWLEDRHEKCCLLLAIDDAEGKITHAKFDYNEGVVAVFNFWKEYIIKNGIPLEIYLDKFSTYKINHKIAEDNKDLLTQFQRASRQLGVKLITANSPEAKGRVERANSTLQDRLIKEMRLKNISTLSDANLFLQNEFIPKFNAKFAVLPRNKANLHKPIHKILKPKLAQIFSIQKNRKIMNDYTILYENQFFQLTEKQPTTVFKKDDVIVEKHLDGQIKISLKGKYLKFVTLPERPKKQLDIPLCALTNNRSHWDPPRNHPWRSQNTAPNCNKKYTTLHK